MGLIADVQYADVPDGVNHDKSCRRHYRGALAALGRAVEYWRSQPRRPDCVAQLGDLIDGQNQANGQSQAALGAALKLLDRLDVVSLVGNHELQNFNRAELAERMRPKPFYHSFKPGAGWRAIVLDSYQLSVHGWPQDDPRHVEAERLLAAHNPNDLGAAGVNWMKGLKGAARRWVPFNGGFGEEQLRWMKGELRDAAEQKERVIVLSHAVLSPQACDGTCMAWDYKEALALVRGSSAVALVVCGHDHKGGYHRDRGVHHLTLRSPLNEPASEAFGTLHALGDRLELRGPNLAHLLPLESCGGSSGGQTGPAQLLTLDLKPLGSGPARVLLLRHGESVSNAAGDHSMENPRLTSLGRAQATAWSRVLGTLNINCALVSPLHRTVETAVLAGLGPNIPMELCRHARELYWTNAENWLGSEQQVRALLQEYGDCGQHMGGVAHAFKADASEKESIVALQRVLRDRPEQTVLIVCHFGVIKALCGGIDVQNGALVECERCQTSGKLRVVRTRDCPLGA